MNKFIFSLVAVLGLLAMVKNVSANSRYDSGQFIQAPTSSGSVSGLSKGCVVEAVYASTDTAFDAGNFFILINTNPIANPSALSLFNNDDYRSPPVQFAITTMTTSGYFQPIHKVIDYGDGISFSTAPYVYRSATNSGLARRVFLKVR